MPELPARLRHASAKGPRPVELATSGHRVEGVAATRRARSATPGFAQSIIAWQHHHGRHHLPWQGTRDPYRIWLSEVMLQQTQVASVIPYFQRFVAAFPRVQDLAAAPLDEVMRLWSGLGYYSRARNLHRCAVAVVERHAGRFPSDSATLAGLPGIGRSTAAAIAAFAAGERAAILDGNVRRVLCRVFGIEGWPGERPVETRLWDVAERELPLGGIEAYTQGLMDLGATVCTRATPACERCPVGTMCIALREDRIGSLPASRPKRAAPTRRCRMFLVRGEAGWLIEKRPPTGIWGGLWSLPQSELEDHTGAEVRPVAGRSEREPGEAARSEAERVAARHGLRISATRPLPAFVHVFTHFRLWIEPLVCDVQAVEAASDCGAIWLAQGAVADAALPQPVKRLLLSLREPGAAASTGAPATAG